MRRNSSFRLPFVALVFVSALTSMPAANAAGDPLGFDAGFRVASSANPSAIASADFDRDGRKDLAVASYTSNRVDILRGDDSPFLKTPGPATGTNPIDVVAGDFDGDGSPDLVTANYGSNSLSVLRNDGRGSLVPRATLATGANPQSIAVGSFDGDSAKDLAVANYGSSSVTIFRGDGSGSFATGQSITVGKNPRAVKVGDFNRDGKQDLAVANYGVNTVSVLLGDGAGAFGARTEVSVSGNPASLAVTDLNADGKDDLISANYTASSVSVLLGNGAGGFAAPVRTTVGVNPIAIALGDFDANGKQDVAVANFGSNNVTILTANASGSLSNIATLAVGTNPFAVSVDTLDGNQTPDLAVANFGSATVSVSASVLTTAGPTGWVNHTASIPAPLCAPADQGWAKCDTAVSPDAPGVPSMAYDPVRANTVLFGGCKETATPRTTVQFADGTSWTSASAAEALKPFCVTQSGDTWTLRDGAWTKYTGAGPHARWYAHMSFDKTTGWVLLSGGLYTAVDEPIAPAGSKSCWGSAYLLKNVTNNSDGPNTFNWAYNGIKAVTATDESVSFNGKPLNAYCFNDTWAWTGSEWRKLNTDGAPTPRFDGAISSDQTAACTTDNFGACSTSAGLVTIFGGCQGIGLMGSHGDTMHPHHWECSRYSGDYGASEYIRNATSGLSKPNACETSGDLCERKVSIGDTWEWHGNAGGAPDANGINGRWTRTCPDACTPMKTACKDGVDASGNPINAPGVDWDSQSFCAPAMRDGSTMVYNPTTKAYQLMGGWYYNPQWVYNGILGDSWEWHPTGTCTTDAGNGADNNKTRSAPCWQNVFATWKKANWASPQPQSRAWGNSAAVPIGSKWQQVIYGGLGVVDGRNPAALGDAWTWQEPDGCTDGVDVYDKTCWQPLSPAVLPPARRGSAMTYDARAGVVVLFGGLCDPLFDASCTTGTRTDTWLLKA